MTKRLFWLNGIAILAVVLNHAVGWGFTALFWWTDRYRAVSVPNFDALGSPTYDVLLVLKQLTPFSVPAFLVVSGFFIAFAGRAGLNWKMIGARLKNILIPYLIWSLVLIGMDFALGQPHPISVILVKLLSGDASPIYYYVPLICQLFLLSPLLVPQIRSVHWKKILLAAAILQACTLAWSYLALFRVVNWKPNWFFGNLIFFFVSGIALNFHADEIRPWIQARRKWWLAGLAVFSVLTVFETEWFYRTYAIDWRGGVETIAATLYTFSFLLTFIGYDQIQLPQATLFYKLGQMAYGIYLLHPIVLMLAAKFMYHAAPAVLGIQFLFVPILFLAGILVPWLAMWVVSRTPLRKMYAYLFG
ncbi:uncharacterized protein conserved in bacteria [Longilinea arvoryzae]|uniref:Uncharacterized protein conserved in bacteria n=1 Tax=Longilinea arvoryzae TaxID=360412 RepID=A0A0S7BDG8_9CHLR|nr:acyltransferase [Longilinea arvoryzae]GAP13453.1 uncharacterized protein conserved in bacteria [Longilinea arvoryzae]